MYLHAACPSLASPTSSCARSASRRKTRLLSWDGSLSIVNIVTPYLPRCGQAFVRPLSREPFPGRLPSWKLAPRAGIIEIPHLSPCWVGGVGGGVHRGRPGPKTFTWITLYPLSPCRLVQSVWLRIPGCYPLLDLTVLIADWKYPVGRLDRSSVRRLAHNCVGKCVGFCVGSQLKEKREICDNPGIHRLSAVALGCALRDRAHSVVRVHTRHND